MEKIDKRKAWAKDIPGKNSPEALDKRRETNERVMRMRQQIYNIDPMVMVPYYQQMLAEFRKFPLMGKPQFVKMCAKAGLPASNWGGGEGKWRQKTFDLLEKIHTNMWIHSTVMYVLDPDGHREKDPQFWIRYRTAFKLMEAELQLKEIEPKNDEEKMQKLRAQADLYCKWIRILPGTKIPKTPAKQKMTDKIGQMRDRTNRVLESEAEELEKDAA